MKHELVVLGCIMQTRFLDTGHSTAGQQAKYFVVPTITKQFDPILILESIILTTELLGYDFTKKCKM